MLAYALAVSSRLFSLTGATRTLFDVLDSLGCGSLEKVHKTCLKCGQGVRESKITQVVPLMEQVAWLTTHPY